MKLKTLIVLVLAMTVLIALPAANAAIAPPEEQRLVVYTSHKEDVYAPILREFENRTGIWVSVVAGGTTEMLERISFEAEAPICDVMFGGGVESLTAYSQYFTLPPEELARLPEKMRRWLGLDGPFEFRYVWPRDELHPAKRPAFQHIWFRLVDRVEDSPVLQRALLAYASDFQLLGTANYPHGISYYQPNVQMASLDHALWFHRPFRADDWLLYSIDSPSVQDARGLARGQIFDRHGKLVASTAQEGMIRVGGAN